MSSTIPIPSFTFTPPFLQSQTPHPGSNGQNGGGGGGPSSSLYLYTFLVTLALLLIISTTIIARSLLIRRRIRLAILNGTYPDPALARLRPGGEPGAKPKMWEVCVDAGADEKGTTPLAGAVLDPRRSLGPAPSETKPPRTRPRPRFLIPRFPRLRTPPHTPPPAPSSSSSSSGPPDAEESRELDTVQLALLIAMPAPHPRAPQALPPLELGIRTTSGAV